LSGKTRLDWVLPDLISTSGIVKGHKQDRVPSRSILGKKPSSYCPALLPGVDNSPEHTEYHRWTVRELETKQRCIKSSAFILPTAHGSWSPRLFLFCAQSATQSRSIEGGYSLCIMSCRTDQDIGILSTQATVTDAKR
jgi:hypothetical protein